MKAYEYYGEVLFGDVILIEFPHTDLRGKSRRPALVLYDTGDQDVWVARIPTQAVGHRPTRGRTAHPTAPEAFVFGEMSP